MNKAFFRRKIKAFTLMEMLVVIGMFFTISILVLPAAIKEISVSKSDSAVKDVRSAIYLLGQNAFSRFNNKTYGIALFSDRYVTYVGTDLAHAESSDTFSFSREVTISQISLTGNATEIVFPAGSFRPSVTGSFKVGDSITTYQISINAQGLITYSKL
jgi:type II secretory pathway pseudopilin PulG